MDPVVWALTDDRAGNVSQCLGTAEALGLPMAVKKIAYDRAGALPNLLRGASLLGVTAESRAALTAPWPQIVVAAGRRTGPVARWIKRQCGAFLVQLMDPGVPRGDFDLIAIPQHDGPRPERPNEMRTIGAPHRVTPQRLEAEAAVWRERLSHLPRPWVALIVGGATKSFPFDPEMAADLGARVSALTGALGGSLLITTSRRTGAAASAALSMALSGPRQEFIWQPGATENPYFGFLGLADAIVVTGESMSMCTEACAAGKAVYIHAPGAFGQGKFARLHEELYGAGYARPLGDAIELWEHAPCNPAKDIAAEVVRRLK